MTRLRFNDLGLLLGKCPRIHNGGPQRVEIDMCERCNRVLEIDWEHKLVACNNGGKIATKLEDFISVSTAKGSLV
jgi:hypothetical protein